MFKSIRNAFKVKELRGKLLYTLMMLVVIRFGSQLPIPGIETSFFADWFERQSTNAFGFFNAMTEPKQEVGDANVLYEVDAVIKDRREHPVEGSYTNYLFNKGIDKILKKVGEESAETIIAAKNNAPDEIIYETSDLFYHVLVMLQDRGVALEEIFKELKRRR